jgi:peptide subunit release factor 1 (eRF1)
MDDGEIIKLYSDESMVPKKQGSGGQSALRFQRNRDLAIIEWYKKINQYLLHCEKQNIIVGMNYINWSTFQNYLHTYTAKKIARRISCEYSGICGIYDCINRLEKEKFSSQ